MPVARGLHDVIGELERGFGLEDESLAVAIGVAPPAIGRWRNGQEFSQRATRVRLDHLSALLTPLEATFQSAEAARSWMHTDNRYLDHVKPVDALRAGRLETITAALEAFDAGLFI